MWWFGKEWGAYLKRPDILVLLFCVGGLEGLRGVRWTGMGVKAFQRVVS